ncbi:MAG: hypothetical protein KBS74_01305 [Clostridiales bacterium]|nr:hypothetical protein [Candidatus Cacconaster stercorequi]
MNTIETNRKAIDAACQNIFGTLKKWYGSSSAFADAAKAVDAMPYIQEEKNKRIGVEVEKLNGAVSQYGEAVRAQIEKISEAADAISGSAEITDDVYRVLSIVDQLEGSIPASVRSEMVRPYKGQKTILELLYAAFEKASGNADLIFRGLIFDVEARISNLNAESYSVIRDPERGFSNVARFAGSVEKFADDMGVELSRRFTDYVDLSGANNEVLHGVRKTAEKPWNRVNH